MLDGPDGCGKSTQTQLLVKWLGENGIETAKFRDPGDTAIGEQIREILLNPEHLAMSTETEVLLYMAARTQLWVEKIAPALKENHCVIMDRWLSSTCAYQGWAGGFGIERIMQIAETALERIQPDLTIILDIKPADAAERMNRELDRMEAKGRQYHNKVREGFMRLADSRKDICRVDASAQIEEVHKDIVSKIKEHFNL